METLINLIVQNKKTIIIIAIGLLISLIIRLIKHLIKKGQKNKELRQATEDRFRDENLNNIILNSQGNVKGKKEVYTPYDVDYRNGEQTKNNISGEKNNVTSKQIMIQLIEKTELSTRKFLLNPAKKIKIGSDLQNNDISVLAEGISPHQCEIFSVGNKIFIRNIDDKNKTIIKRKREQAFVDNKGIRILSDDIIILGKVTYAVTIVD